MGRFVVVEDLLDVDFAEEVDFFVADDVDVVFFNVDVVFFDVDVVFFDVLVVFAAAVGPFVVVDVVEAFFDVDFKLDTLLGFLDVVVDVGLLDVLEDDEDVFIVVDVEEDFREVVGAVEELGFRVVDVVVDVVLVVLLLDDDDEEVPDKRTCLIALSNLLLATEIDRTRVR